MLSASECSPASSPERQAPAAVDAGAVPPAAAALELECPAAGAARPGPNWARQGSFHASGGGLDLEDLERGEQAAPTVSIMSRGASSSLSLCRMVSVNGLQVRGSRLAVFVQRALLASAAALVADTLRWAAMHWHPFILCCIGCSVAMLACGYFGVRSNDKLLLCIFSMCNICMALLTVLFYIMDYLSFLVVDDPHAKCMTMCDSEKRCGWAQGPTLTQFEEWTCPRNHFEVFVVLSLSSFMCCMNFFAAWAANKLYEELDNGKSIVVAPRKRMLAEAESPITAARLVGMQAH